MSLDFFKAECREPSLNNNLFGLCDDQDGSKAYTNINDPTKWIATVKNEKNKILVFTAIDKCVINDNEQIGRGRCDCMLSSDEHIFFIELKDKLPPWQKEAKDQLESTIQFFIDNHDITIYKHKKVFACNKKVNKFVVIDSEENRQFFRKYKFRLDLQSEIIIV